MDKAPSYSDIVRIITVEANFCPKRFVFLSCFQQLPHAGVETYLDLRGSDLVISKTTVHSGYFT